MPKTSEQAARQAAGAVWLSFVVAVGVGSWLPIAGCGKDGQADKERGASTQPASASATAAGAREKDQSDPVGAAKLHAAGVVMFATALVEKDAAGRDKALAMMERAVVADEAQAAYKIDLADAYVQLDREILIPAALDLYEEVLAAEPKNEAVLGRIAQAYGRLGNPAAAFAFAKKRLAAAESESGVNMAASQVGFLALEAEQWAAGLDLLASARERFPGNQALLLLTAALQQGAGQQAEAMANVQRVIDSGQANERVLAQAKAMKERMGGQ